MRDLTAPSAKAPPSLDADVLGAAQRQILRAQRER